MFAKILNNNKVYYSPVFALTMKGRNNKAIVLDESFTQLVVVDFFQKYEYKMLFLDYNAENFAINENDFKSYWNDRKIFEIVKRKKYTQKMLDDAKELLSKSTKQDFVEQKAKQGANMIGQVAQKVNPQPQMTNNTLKDIPIQAPLSEEEWRKRLRRKRLGLL